jgi:prepilin-type N-terminal cleavage/methylation domain-containing protein
MQKGFTLIEVLVVVLIIGILTSVALPQYQKSVMRSRFAQMVVANNAIYNAQKVYYSTHHKYAETMDELDISLPLMRDVMCEPNYYERTLCTLSSNNATLAVIEQFYSNDAIQCCAYKGTKFAGASLCEAEMGTKVWTSDCGGSCHCYWKQ